MKEIATKNIWVWMQLEKQAACKAVVLSGLVGSIPYHTHFT